MPRTQALAALALACSALGLVDAVLGGRGVVAGVGFVGVAACAAVLLRGERRIKPKLLLVPEVALGGELAYELVTEIARGSMGEVWQARHKLLDRPTALKRIKTARLDPEDLARFKREARATARLSSPHTVDIYDFGVDELGFFYAMELLDGFDLQRLVDRSGPLAPARAIAILLQACHSLAEAHSVGVVHRDIKPANVMLCRYGLDFDFVKLLDFGLAKQRRSKDSAAGLTRQGAVLGTTAFIAPESLKGSASVDGRADLYSLAAVGFWLLTGKLLFDHDKPLAMARAHLLEQPPLVSSATRNPIPPELDALIAQCLSKEPSERPQTATELRDRLLVIRIAEPWTEADARAWWQSQ